MNFELNWTKMKSDQMYAHVSFFKIIYCQFVQNTNFKYIDFEDISLH